MALHYISIAIYFAVEINWVTTITRHETDDGYVVQLSKWDLFNKLNDIRVIKCSEIQMIRILFSH